MLSVILFVCIISCGTILASKDLLSHATQVGMELLEKSRIEGVTIRECSCHEQEVCVNQFKENAHVCIDSCWSIVGKLTAHPDQLLDCFKKQQPLIDSFLKCIGASTHSCVQTENGPQIPKQDIRKLIVAGEQDFETSKKSFIHNPALQPYMRIVNGALDFANCFKDCYVKMHEKGFCFDKQGCQPLLQGLQAKKLLKKCAKRINWKAGAGELCECSLHAGLKELKNFCPLLRAMTRKIQVH
ncbi:unnamed protein product [Anisakis simplex]|uniref:Chondroitin proteoglycan 4 domain-containing protein n=1 Tax=Anisakis simplex TaxID=6269 RepID=A0A0M3JUE9_ANISI|nr:unnamed protein product [Anisakis simplex]